MTLCMCLCMYIILMAVAQCDNIDLMVVASVHTKCTTV